MPAFPRKLLRIEDLDFNQAKHLIDQAQNYKNTKAKKNFAPALNGTVALVFLEPSTRTRFSFEMAARRLGLSPVCFTNDSTTSVAKGESLHETLSTIIAMRPDALVVRHAGDAKVQAILNTANIPVVNAGDGVGEHPTQALLDAMTIIERRGQIKGEKILFVGDVGHSRVARSGRNLFRLLGAEVGVCGPKEFWPKDADWKGIQTFEKLDEALVWATVCMGLRIQAERHAQKSGGLENYIKNYRIEPARVATWRKDGVIMHPGPYVPGVDLVDEILEDSRTAIHDQVTNGVYVRMAVLAAILGGS